MTTITSSGAYCVPAMETFFRPPIQEEGNA
jgi:hypothetical protein